MLTLGVITDIHFGPDTHFDGRLRKLSHSAPALTGAFVTHMRERVKPDLVVNLGDIVEDESPGADQRRYHAGLEQLRGAGAELVNVAGNHDRVNMRPDSLRRAWGMSPDGPLYYSMDRGGVHLVILYGHERSDRDVTVDDDQLSWLEADLAATKLPTVVLMHHSAADQDLTGNRWFEGLPHICLIKRRRRIRELIRDSRTELVLNGHLHWNHLAVHDGIPYLTLQSLIENVQEDAPGVAAAAHAVVKVGSRSVSVEVAGVQPARYHFEARCASDETTA